MVSPTPLHPTHLHVDRHDGDPDAPVLLLLHGLGGTGAVWHPLIDVLGWSGDVIVPDLRGHGRSPWTDLYSFGAMAADLAGLIGPRRPTAIVGHSMGAVVGLGLATGWFGIDVTHLTTVGIKVVWSEDEIAAIDRIAAKPARVFGQVADAREWAAKLAGLFGVIDPDDPMLDGAVTAVDGGYRASLDPRAGLVGPPPLEPLHAAVADVPIVHCLGDRDPMVSPDQSATMGRDVHVIADAGHNAMVEQPAEVAAVLNRLTAS